VKLYEVRNGFIGEGYVRVYVWSPDEETARQLAADAFRKDDESENYWTNLEVEELFDARRAPFATAPSDCGWKTQQ
jgi:hypothetical protein